MNNTDTYRRLWNSATPDQLHFLREKYNIRGLADFGEAERLQGEVFFIDLERIFSDHFFGKFANKMKNRIAKRRKKKGKKPRIGIFARAKEKRHNNFIARGIAARAAEREYQANNTKNSETKKGGKLLKKGSTLFNNIGGLLGFADGLTHRGEKKEYDAELAGKNAELKAKKEKTTIYIASGLVVFLIVILVVANKK